MVDDTLKPCSCWNESGYTRIMIAEFFLFSVFSSVAFTFFALLLIIVCNDLALCLPYCLSYLSPLVLSLRLILTLRYACSTRPLASLHFVVGPV